MFGIGALSRATGCPIDTIRYYEKLGLLEKPFRTEGGHRLYNSAHQKRLSFILKTRKLGFTLEKTRELLSLAENTERFCHEALTLVDNNLHEVSEKIAELQLIQNVLLRLSKDCQTCCPEAKAPQCTIVDALSNA